MTSLAFAATGAAQAAGARHLMTLVADQVASRIFEKDPSLWGAEAESESAIRLGWVEAPEISAPLVEQILALRQELLGEGVNHIVLCGMGGSSLAPEVIAATAGVELSVLDSTDPDQVRAAVSDRLVTTAIVVSSKSGSTLEADSQRRIFEQEFTAAGIDAKSRIIIVTDPGSPLDQSAREAGYRQVFNADPNVGGRYSGLTAFGLVPSGLAGVDIAALLDSAERAAEMLRDDDVDNVGLRLGAALGGTVPLRNKIVIVDEGSSLVRFADWVEQLIAESTGKLGTGVLPVVADPHSPEVTGGAADVLTVRLVAGDADVELRENEVSISGDLGAQMMVWEFATAVAGRLLGINPFDQPDVEAAKSAARGLLDATPAPTPALFTDGAVEVRTANEDAHWLDGAKTLAQALTAVTGTLPEDGYLSVQVYLDRLANAPLEQIRNDLAGLTRRPVTFGWGPRFLHSTGQFHKGGPAIGVFVQVTGGEAANLAIPERPFTFGELIAAQAAGDAAVLAEHRRPVLRLHFNNVAAGVAQLKNVVADLAGPPLNA
ncbi:glucose-6-phosphate isomerase [Paenarthrobacter sp. PH39-S1]|uniref:glucose-6-phosphate isomerase n=1 Tax=Paenarthrobacter sp. PH39-S1 TaxID=3046204 RepID=UPI0024B8AF38|nr:glucose-6-phosphate isomerase [Paenarthrobacter sp. PH39-S1]MDJ0358215.1 glucose-6-phosphate isomerase [Paenarthrobacter sp. PH39-S1]